MREAQLFLSALTGNGTPTAATAALEAQGELAPIGTKCHSLDGLRPASMVRICRPLATSKILAVPSSLADANRVPSGLNERLMNQSV